MAFPPYFPTRLEPISNTTPVTYRDGTNLTRMVEELRCYVRDQLPAEMDGLLGKFFTDFSAALGAEHDWAALSLAEQNTVFNNAIDGVNAIIETINNKSGDLDIQRTTLTGPYTVTVDPTWPTNQPVDLVLTQDETGGHAVTFGPSIEGTVAVATHAGGETSFTLVPGADGVWTVIQPDARLETRARAAESKAARRAWIGARVGPAVGETQPEDEHYFDNTHALEAQMNATFDIVNWYAAVNADVVERYRTEILTELAANPERKVMYALEIHRSNDDFLAEFDAHGDVYTYLTNLFTLMRDSGTAHRVYLAPFHEGNGPGGAYPWQMNDTSNGNSIAKYAECYKRVVTLARDLGLPSKFIQWFLTSNGGGADDSRDISKGFVGDAWVDLIGVSYYNRAFNGASETAVGGTLTRFMRHVEGMSSRNVWICETGCYPSNATHNKGTWYADLIKLVASNQFPRITAMCMFMADGNSVVDGVTYSVDKRLENAEQKRRVGQAINDARRTGSYGNPADLTRNLIPRSISVPSKTSDWTKFASPGLVDLTLNITNNVPDNVDKINTSLRVTKPYSNGISTDYRVYRSVAQSEVDFEPNRVHTTGFWARASYDGFKLGFGVRQTGGNLIAGDSRIQLSTQWEYYNTPFATGIDTNDTWQFPHMTLGDNVAAGWFEITDMQISRGSHPTPDVAKVLVPRIRDAADAPTIRLNAESADTWIVTLGGDRLIDAPVGAAYDGQVMTVRVRQDATGGRVLARSADTRWFVSSESLTGMLTTAPFSQTLVTLMYFADQDKWGITKVTKMNFT